MPFTLAHPAIVIPLEKTGLRFSLTGLVIGSMVPDFEFFLQMRAVENVGHHWYGIFLFDLPVAVFAAFIFHNLLRNQLVENLPDIYRDRFIQFKDFDWNHYAKNNKWILFLSILIGVLSHLGLDAFTHHDGFVVEWIPSFSDTVNLLGARVPVYLLLQILCSIWGMVIVQLQIMRLPVQPILARKKVDHRYWMAFTLFFFSILSLRLIVGPDLNDFGDMAIAIMGSFLYSWILVAILLKTKSETPRVKSGVSFK